MSDTARFPETCYETPLYNKKVTFGQLGTHGAERKFRSA